MHTTELDNYWDAFVLSQRPPGTEPFDGETTDLIERLWALGAPSDSELARERVWRRLQQHRAWEERDVDAGARVQNASVTHSATIGPVGSRAPLPSHNFGQAGWRSAIGLLATAALLVLALAGSFFAFGPGRPGQEFHAQAYIPAMSVPLAAPETEGVATTPLLDLVIPTFGDDKAWVQFDRYTFPGATKLELDIQGGQVPEVFFVVDGALEIRALDSPQPVRVIRSGGTKAEESLRSGESVALTAGDAVVIPENAAANLMNMAPEPAVALLLIVPSEAKYPTGTDIGIVSPVGSIRNLRAPLTLALEEVTVAPGASLPGVNAPDVERAVVPVDPDRVMDARIGSNGSLHNAGDEPLQAYVLTVTSGALLP
jgi:mannose-6-phosphate isomerase-like protein (cupin superfamily)